MLPCISTLFAIPVVLLPDQVPPVIITFEVPEVDPFIAIPPEHVSVSDAVGEIVVVPEIVKAPDIAKLPDNVFVLALLHVIGKFHVTPLLVIVDAADIVTPELPAREYAL